MLLIINNHVADPATGDGLARAIGVSAGLPYQVVHFSQLDADALAGKTGVVSCGYPDPYRTFDCATAQKVQLELLRRCDRPFLGICGGHQLLAMAYGGTVAAMPGGGREDGPGTVLRAGRDPVLDGLPETFTVWQDHGWEVAGLPPGFALLLQGERCRVQGMRHLERSLYGVQFHPEIAASSPRWGERLLANFFRLAADGGDPVDD